MVLAMEAVASHLATCPTEFARKRDAVCDYSGARFGGLPREVVTSCPSHRTQEPMGIDGWLVPQQRSSPCVRRALVLLGNCWS